MQREWTNRKCMVDDLAEEKKRERGDLVLNLNLNLDA